MGVWGGRRQTGSGTPGKAVMMANLGRGRGGASEIKAEQGDGLGPTGQPPPPSGFPGELGN